MRHKWVTWYELSTWNTSYYDDNAFIVTSQMCILLLYVHVMIVSARATVHDNFVEVILSFHLEVGPRTRTQVVDCATSEPSLWPFHCIDDISHLYPYFIAMLPLSQGTRKTQHCLIEQKIMDVCVFTRLLIIRDTFQRWIRDTHGAAFPDKAEWRRSHCLFSCPFE